MAINWYTRLDPTRIRSWEDFVATFLRQYKYNTDIEPDRIQLQNMAKSETETFKEYAQWWREVATQVEPPLSDKEMLEMFISIVEHPFYKHMICNVSSNFADIVIIEERIEAGIKSGKIAQDPSTVVNINEFGSHSGANKEGKTHQNSTTQFSSVANLSPIFYLPPYQPRIFPHPKQNWKPKSKPTQKLDQVSSQKALNLDKRFVKFTPIPMTYTKLLPNLLHNTLVTVCPIKPVQPPSSKHYDADARCDYHGRDVGHSTEQCMTLKYKVQSLIESGLLCFKEDKPDAPPYTDWSFCVKVDEKIMLMILLLVVWVHLFSYVNGINLCFLSFFLPLWLHRCFNCREYIFLWILYASLERVPKVSWRMIIIIIKQKKSAKREMNVKIHGWVSCFLFANHQIYDFPKKKWINKEGCHIFLWSNA